MKTIEEKAKAYDEALERAKQIIMDYDYDEHNNVFMEIFPELMESEDERIKKALIRFHKSTIDIDGIKGNEIVDWIEKQGEQKPTVEMKSAEESLGIDSETYNKIMDECIYGDDKQKPAWSEEESIISDLLDYFDEDKCLKHEVNDIIKWLKTIKPQQKGWGENEIKMLDNLITYLDGRKDLLEEIKKSIYIDWLKSLKDIYTWKPSDEQMKALHDLNLTGNISHVGQGQELINLYNDLKKLKGE